jgi:hypothetical protein
MFLHYNVESLDYLANRNIGGKGEPNRRWFPFLCCRSALSGMGSWRVESPGVDQSEGQLLNYPMFLSLR